MAKKILKTLVNNLGFKILAVVLAFILWLVVYNIDDPKKSKTFTTNVTVENASAVTDMNKCYEVLDGTNTVTFTVTGKRSELEKLKSDKLKNAEIISENVEVEMQDNVCIITGSYNIVKNIGTEQEILFEDE